MLTGKAKEDFEDWVIKTKTQFVITDSYGSDLEVSEFFDRIKELEIALIVEWLDSEELFFWVYRTESGYWATSFERKAKYDDRLEALIDGIEIVNCIYNDGK